MEYKDFNIKSEKLRIERERLIDQLVDTMGGKIRYYNILEIADECRPFFSHDIPKEILSVFRNDVELTLYKKIVDNRVEFDDLWSQYRNGGNDE